MRIQTDDKEVLDRVPLAASTGSMSLRGRTDSSGNCTLKGAIPAETALLYVFVNGSPIDGPFDQMRADIARYKEVARQYSFRCFYPLKLTPASDSYSLTITAYVAVTVEGRLLDAKGRPADSYVRPLDSPQMVLAADQDGAFSVGGVRKGVATGLLYAVGFHEYKFVSLSADQLQKDLNIGDVVVSPSAADAPISITVNNRSELRDDLCDKKKYVALIGRDGIRFYSFVVDDFGKAVRKDRQPIAVSAGEYYVVPGPVDKDRTCAKLIQLVRSARQLDLDAAGVPRLTAVAGSKTSVAIDAAKAEAAVIAVAGDD